MKIISIEPTPSPHSMKINVNEHLEDGETLNYKSGDDLSKATEYIQKLFEINGISGIYRVIDFITIQRRPRVEWEDILPKVRDLLGGATNEAIEDIFAPSSQSSEDAYGEINVFVQEFRNIPMQVKVEEHDHEKRFGLPERFTDAAIEASEASDNMLMERKWVEKSPRYGKIDDIGQEVVEELSASYDKERLTELIKAAFSEDPEQLSSDKQKNKVTLSMLDQPDWRDRYATMDRMDPTIEDLPVLDKALEDDRSSIRRLATAYLGMIEETEVLPYLYKALKDKAVNVRRTAGDCLSDLGFTEAMPEMILSLSDPSRLVRWRAAMFLYEVGDESAIPALEKALEDPEFEVRMQVKMALDRIQEGKKAEGSIWHLMNQATKQD